MRRDREGKQGEDSLSTRNKTADEMTDDIVNNQIVALKKLMDNQEICINDIDVFCEKGNDVLLRSTCSRLSTRVFQACTISSRVVESSLLAKQSVFISISTAMN